MNKYTCLFHLYATLPDAVREVEMEKFFYRMTFHLKYSKQQMIALSAIYSQYGIFKAPFTEEDIDRIATKFQMDSPHGNCKTFVSRNYSDTGIKEHACKSCIYSTNYQNARESQERYALRYLLYPSKSQYISFQFDSEAFHSVKRLCDDYVISDSPYIKIYKHLYLFIEREHGWNRSQIALCENFIQYLNDTIDLESIIAKHGLDRESVNNCLKLYIKDIYRIKDAELSDELFTKTVELLRSPYTYSPPGQVSVSAEPLIPEDSDKLKPSKETARKPGKKKKKDPSKQIDLFSAFNSIVKDMDTGNFKAADETSDEETDKKPTLEDGSAPDPEQENTTKPEIKKPVVENASSPKTDEIPSESKQNIKPVETSLEEFALPFVSDILEKTEGTVISEADCPVKSEQNSTIEEEKISKNESATSPFSDPGIPDEETISSMLGNIKMEIEGSSEEAKSQTYMSTLHKGVTTLHKFTQLSVGFELTQIESTYTRVNTTNHFEYISAIAQSEYVSVECAYNSEESGILLYASSNKTLYYVNPLLFGIEMLQEISESDETIFITEHTLEVYTIMAQYGWERPKIQGIDVFYHIYKRENIDLSDDPTLKKNGVIDTLSELPDKYRYLHGKLSETNNFQTYNNFYTKALRILAVMANNYILSDLSDSLNPSFKRKDFMDFCFTFDWKSHWKVPGIMFRIGIENIPDRSFEYDSFYGELCLMLSRLHLSQRQKTYLISATDKAFYLFYQGSKKEALLVYDVVMADLQEFFQDHLNDIMRSNTYCVSYTI